MDRPSFDEYLADRNLRAARLLALLAAVLVPSGVILDWCTHREDLTWLFLLRIAAAVVAAVCLLLTYLRGAQRHTFALGLAPILATAIAIEVMIESLEGYASPYYAGLTHCLFALGVIFYWRVPQILLACFLVLAVWLIPTFAQAAVIELAPFANNFFALGVAAAIAVASNGSRFRSVEREYSARANLVDALEQLKELDHAKNQFFANVSHELRTPLTLIVAPTAELLEREALDDATRGVLQVVQRHAARLLRHIDELLDLSGLDAGRLRLDIAEIDVGALLATQVEISKPAAAANEIELSLEASERTEKIWADAHRLDIIVTNLIGNALKYTPAGGRIIVRLRKEGDSVIVDVADTGPGIPEADLPRVFERFYQASQGERRRQGHGIGLALAKELAELHGGSLTVNSRLGEGSTFTLRLRTGRGHFKPEVIERRQSFRPDAAHDRRYEDAKSTRSLDRAQVPVPPLSDSAAVAYPDGRRPHVVVVEDQADLRDLIRRLLEASYDVHEAKDGREALEYLRTASVDLVVSDIMMPRMSGTELCRMMKSDPVLRTVPIILLTARVGSEATMDAYAHGADDFVSKPFHPRVLCARVSAQLKLRALALQLIAQEKAATIGTLAAGVAHEVRNPVNAITGASRVLLREEYNNSEQQKRLLNVVMDAAWRIDAIVAALDAHARPAELDVVRPFDLREGIEATLRLLDQRMEDVQIHRDYSTEKQALVRAAAVNQVVLNLLDNALKAGARNVWIRLVEQGERIVVGVADDGRGVPAEIHSRIFDPFFTTREPGQGTGLGLHLAHKIVSEHGGRLWHEQRDGGGARFSFDVPSAA